MIVMMLTMLVRPAVSRAIIVGIVLSIYTGQLPVTTIGLDDLQLAVG